MIIEEEKRDETDYFKGKHCRVDLEPTPIAIQTWNEASGAIVGLFHITC